MTKYKKTNKRDGDPFQGGNSEGGEVFNHQETPLTGGSVGSFGISDGHITRRGKKNPHRLAPNCNSQWDGSSKRRLYTWTSPDGQYRNQIDYILYRQMWRRSIQSAKTRPGADCGSDHELLIAKFSLKLKKVGKNIRPFRYDLNQIPYDYTVEVRNRSKGLDLIECLKNYGQRFVTLYRRQ